MTSKQALLPLLSLLSSLSVTSLAFAEESPPSAPPAEAATSADDVVTVREITIVGRIQKPIAAVDVSRIQPKMTLAELRQPFLDRIERAIYHAPF